MLMTNAIGALRRERVAKTPLGWSSRKGVTVNMGFPAL
jgi:hypothetical protein